MKQIKEKSEHFKNPKHFWRSLRTPDKYLLVILAICLFHTIFTLLVPINSGESSPIDIVTRTTSATIFGYFISGNFLRQSSTPIDATELSAPPNNAPVDSTDSAPIAALPKPQKPHIHYAARQITIVAIIGTISLFILLSANYTQASLTHTAAASSQLRDFILGSVGFLISGSNKSPNP